MEQLKTFTQQDSQKTQQLVQQQEIIERQQIQIDRALKAIENLQAQFESNKPNQWGLKNFRQKLILIGGGDHTKDVRNTLVDNGVKEKNIYIYSDNPEGAFCKNSSKLEVNHQSEINYIQALDIGVKIIIAIGSNYARYSIANYINNKYGNNPERYGTVVNPNSYIFNDVEIGTGTVVLPSVNISGGTKIGDHCLVNTGVILTHDDILENFVHLSPGVKFAGNVTALEGANVGIGAVATPGVVIGKWATIGASATLTRSVPNCATVVNHNEIIKIGGIKLNDKQGAKAEVERLENLYADSNCSPNHPMLLKRTTIINGIIDA